MESRAKTHPSQWTVLLDFAEENPSILTKKFDGSSGRIKYNEKWTEITNTLNSMGYLQKSTEKWQKAVGDWKSKVRSKAAALKKGLHQTGGGGPLPPLNENENRLISLLGWSSITGDGNMEMGCEVEQLGNAVSLDSSNTASSSTAQVSPSPPPLVFLSESFENKSNVPSTSENVEPPKKKAKTTGNKKKLGPASHFPLSNTKSGVSSNVQQMHKETLDVLREINTNVKRLSDAQEKMCDVHLQILNFLKNNV